MEEVASFLSDTAQIVHAGHRREMELAVEVPRDELGPVASNEMWGGIYDRLAELIAANRTTLIFVNTRRLAERVAHHLGERLGPGVVLPHHGSLSRPLRLEAERKLKEGELRAVVATASLELGIDIGTVDLVCQIGSPRAIAVGLQRIGRAGHWVGAVPRGRLFTTTRDELIECAALVRAIRKGELDRLEIPRNALDILAQQIVACCASEEWGEDELFEMVRATWPYRTLARSDFDAVIDILSEGIATARGRSGAYLHRDAVNRRLRGRRGARLAAITSGGAIPDSANYLVVAEPEGTIDRNGGRGFRRGEPGRRRLPARHHILAHTPRGGGKSARGGCARRGAGDSFLARRSAGPNHRTVAGSIGAAGGDRGTRRGRRGLADGGVRAGSPRRGTGGGICAGRRMPRWARCRRLTRLWRNAFSTRAAGCS